MKRLISIFLLLMMASCACAEDIDLSGLSYAELVALKDRINLAMWESNEWQEVTVPEGLWTVGKDIPVGHWTISVNGKSSITITCGNLLDATQKQISYNSSVFYYKKIYGPKSYFFSEGMTNYIDLWLYEGYHIDISGGAVVFTPYTGKPSLGFK